MRYNTVYRIMFTLSDLFVIYIYAMVSCLVSHPLHN